MADVFLNLIDPLEERYRWPDKSDREIEVARRDMADAFKQHDVELLQAVMRHVVLTRRYNTMPTVGDLNDVLQRILAERKAAEEKPRRGAGVPSSADAFLDGLHAEAEAAKAWARDWLRKSPLGQESLRDGWCRQLFNLVWQIKRNRTRANQPCGFDDIRFADLATQYVNADDVINSFRARPAANPELEACIVLREKRARVLGEKAA